MSASRHAPYNHSYDDTQHQRAHLSQNFLHDHHLVATLLDRFPLDERYAVYDIGAGNGIITEQLARCYRRVVAVEMDPTLVACLRQRFADRPHVAIHEGDFLQYSLPRQPYSVFANIPFNHTAAIVGKLIDAEQPPTLAYLVMQREAALMFAGEPHESLRTILLKPWFESEIVYHFRRSDFTPAPRVDVVMLRLRKRGPPLIHAYDRQFFRDFVVYLFTHWQPATINPLQHIISGQQVRRYERLLGTIFGPTPTTLSFEQWLALFDLIRSTSAEQAQQIVSGSERRLLNQQRGLHKQHRTRIRTQKM